MPWSQFSLLLTSMSMNLWKKRLLRSTSESTEEVSNAKASSHLFVVIAEEKSDIKLSIRKPNKGLQRDTGVLE